MGNTHHKRKVAHCTKPRPVWYFGLGRPDKQKKAASKSDEDAQWAVHYKPLEYHQENVFLPSTRPPHIEDLHKEAEIGLKSLQEQGTLDSCSELQQGKGQDSVDDCSQISKGEDVPVLPNSGSDGPGDEVWTKTRSLPPPTPDEIRKSALGIQPSESSSGTTFKSQGHQKIHSSFKGPKMKEKRIRRTTIMGLPQHVQQELGLGKGRRPSKTGGTEASKESAGVDLISRRDNDRCFNNLAYSQTRSSLRSITFSDPSQRDNESISTLGLNYQYNWALMNSTNRPKSLAVPQSSVPSELLQSPVMSMSPQATYLSKIIPNAILPPAVDVVMFNTSQNCLRRLSSSDVLYTPSPASSHSISLQNYNRVDDSSDAWSDSQSSETIVSNNSTISSQGNEDTPLYNSTGEEMRVDENLTNTPPDHQASTSRWVSACSAPNASPEAEHASAHLNSNCKPADLRSNGYVDQSLSPAQSTSSIADASDTQSIASERSIARSLSVRKMKKPPAPPRRMHSLQQGEEQKSQVKVQDSVLDGNNDQTKYEPCSELSSGGEPANPDLHHKLVTSYHGSGVTSNRNTTQSANNLIPQVLSSLNQSGQTASPSSVHSSQNGTVVKAPVAPPPPTGKFKPGAGEQLSSVPETSHTASLASKHINLFVIPPPPSSPAPPPPNVRRPTLPTAWEHAWGSETIPPPPAGPAPLPPTKRPSFLFNIPAYGASPSCHQQVTTATPLVTIAPPLVTTAPIATPLITTSASTATSLVTISAPTASPLVSTPAPITAPLVSISVPTATPFATTSAPTASPLVSTPAPTTTPLVSTSVPTATPLVTTSAPNLTPLVSTSELTATSLIMTLAPTATLLVTTSAPASIPLVTTSALSATPLVTTSAPISIPLVTTSALSATPLVTTLVPTTTPLVTMSRNTVGTGSLTPASGPIASQTTSTSMVTSVSSAPFMDGEQGEVPLRTKHSPPPSPPPSHHPPPPPKKSGLENPSPPSSSASVEPLKQDQSALDWPPPPPPLSPSNFTPVEMLQTTAEDGTSILQDAEFLFPPPPPSLLEDITELKTPSDEEPRPDVRPLPAPVLLPSVDAFVNSRMPGESAGLSPCPPRTQPAETSTLTPQPLMLTPSPATTLKEPLPKTQATCPPAEEADSHLPNTRMPDPNASKQDSTQGLAPSPLQQPSNDGQVGAPIVTASLLQMVRLRSESKQQANRNQAASKLPTKSNATPPCKPVRKSLSQRLSSSSDSEPAVSTKPTLHEKNLPLSTTATTPQRHDLLNDETPHKSPASTASFIFSKSVSPKKLVFESPRSPEAEAEVKKNFMAELSSVSERIASKSECKSSSSPQTKAVVEAQKKAGRVPPPVAKKPLFLPGSRRLSSSSTSVRALPNAQESRQILQSVMARKGP
ncbi:NHS-like protein 3 isoform X2 [Narcine bancroftii]|uniref:NHS-like protein 3 isoform X2 n=1 Tax=Narcine bancroftii TaxID=1343680 RepID=UPI0038322091